VNQQYILVLFYRENPHIFLQTVQYENPGHRSRTWPHSTHIRSDSTRCDSAHTQGYVADLSEAGEIDSARFSTQQIGRYVVALRR
jgi:hypothetical protein